MNQTIKYTIVLTAALVFPSCGSNTSVKNKATGKVINKADYKAYHDYWYDKTLAEIGETRIEVAEPTLDFGVLPPGVRKTHRFKVKNVGSKVLCLLAGPKTCKCTEIKIVDREIAPGDTGEVEVTWETVALAVTFSHSASVYTNDPAQRKFRFNIKGHVGTEAAVSPSGFVLGKILPDHETATTSVVLYSEEFEEFEIKDLKTSFGEDAKVEVTPLTDKQKAKFKRLKSGRNLKLTVNRPKERGLFSGNVSFKMVAPNKTIEREISVSGHTVRRIRLEETKTDTLTPAGVVKLGRVPHQTGKKLRYLLTVLDDDKDLKIKNLNVNPGYVKVELKPLNSKVLKHGTYILDISVPEGQSQANFNRVDNFGAVDIEFDHSRVSPLNLILDFYVL